MTTLYLDTEFNGFGGELISMALVPDDESKPFWYAVTYLPNMTQFNGLNPWVKEHVIPVLNKEPMRYWLFKESFQRYITQFKNPTIICDWYSDAIHFCNLMNGPTYDTSLATEFTIKVVRTNGLNSVLPHNALADAEALRMWHRRLSVDHYRYPLDPNIGEINDIAS